MKMSVRRWLGASALAIYIGLGMTGCSGDQDTDEAVENGNQVSEDGDGNSTDSINEGNGEKSGGEETANEAPPSDAPSSDAPPEGGTANSTGDDLQSIITEMNGQQPGAEPKEGAAPEAAPLQAEAPAAPVNNAVATSAAPAPAPAPAVAPAPAAPAPAAETAAAKPSAIPFQPGSAPAANGLPEMGSKMAYIVEKGDTMAKISQKIYGTPSRWHDMAALSGLSNPSRIFPGDLVYYTLEESSVTFAKAYDSVPRTEEQVKQGDTLATISQRLYGSTESWRSLWRHNDKIDNPDVVAPGTTVYYVAKGALQAAIEQVKNASNNLATVKAVDSKDHTTTTAKLIAVSHKRTQRAKALNDLNDLNNVNQAATQHIIDLATNLNANNA